VRPYGDQVCLSEDDLFVDALVAFAHDLNGQLGPGIGFQAAKVSSQVFCVHDRLRNRRQVAADRITDRKFLTYVEIKSYLVPPCPHQAYDWHRPSF
jgi:hypothetical protein